MALVDQTGVFFCEKFVEAGKRTYNYVGFGICLNDGLDAKTNLFLFNGFRVFCGSFHCRAGFSA